jgi:hypothetical protein
VKAYRARLQKDCLGCAADMYRYIHAALEDENNRVYAPRAKALREMKHTLEKENNAPGASSFGQRITGHPGGHSGAAREAEAIIQQTGAEGLIKKFIKSLLDNEPELTLWLDGFIRTQFHTLMHQSMDDCVSSERVENEIAPRLYRDALPVFHLENAAGLYRFPSYGMVSVPGNAPAVLRGIERFRENSLSGLKFNIHRSEMTDRVFWLNTQNGIPLFAYAPLRVYEALYEDTIHGKEGVGRHFWHNLPSPLPESVWGDTYFNPRQKAENDRLRGIFTDALRLGSIALREDAARHNGSRYSAVLREDFDPEPYAFDETTGANTLFDLSQCLRALQTKGGPPVTEKRLLFNSPTEELALAHFLRNPLLAEAVGLENEKHKKIAELLGAVNSLQDERDRDKTDANDFLTALACEAFTKQNGQYVYHHAPEEAFWPPLVNVLEEADHPEYALFLAFKALPPDKREAVKRRAKELRASFPEGRLLVNLRKWQGVFALRKEALDKERAPVKTRAYDFYHGISLRVNTQIAAMV